MFTIFGIIFLNFIICFNFDLCKCVDVNNIKINEYNDYVSLVSDVQEYIQAQSVFIIYAGNDESIRTMTLMKDLIFKFSTKSVLSFVQNFTNVLKYRDYYHGRIIRPLYVVFLSCHKEVEMFQKVTQNYDMSYPKWLLIFTEQIGGLCSKPPANYLNVAFDTIMLVKCYRDATIREWYSLYGEQLIVKDLAVWHIDKGLKLKTDKALYDRRNSLDGIVLKIAVVKYSPFINSETDPISGYFGKIIRGLSHSLNFTINIKYKDVSYGTYDHANKSWSGVIGRLARKEADMGVSEFTMTKARLNAVDFTLPIVLSRNYLYMKKPDLQNLQWSAHFKVYSYRVWFTAGIVFIISFFVVLTIRFLKKERSLSLNFISETYLLVHGIYCQQGISVFASSSSTRIAYVSILLKSVVFQAMYSACLICYLTSTSPCSPFNSIYEFAMDGTYKLVALSDSSSYSLFTTSKDWVLMKMTKQMKARENMPTTMVAGFEQACQPKVAFYTSEAVRRAVNSRIPCDLVHIITGRVNSLGIILTKKSQFTGVINHHILKYKNVGIMSRFKSHHYVEVIHSDNRYDPVGLRGIVTILMILFAGMLMSFVILAIEVVVHRVTSARRNRKTNGIVVSTSSLHVKK